MKKSIVILSAVLLVGLLSATAQNSKVGHVNSNDLLELMPEREQAAKDVQAFAQQIEGQLKTMSAEYETKLKEYQSQQALMTDPRRMDAVQEITDLENRIQQFQQTAQESLAKKENEILKPIIDRAKKAIDDVAKEKGYDYILDTGLGMVLYANDSHDILSLVKKKLGLK